MKFKACFKPLIFEVSNEDDAWEVLADIIADCPPTVLSIEECE